jgi:hypothetical protein
MKNTDKWYVLVDARILQKGLLTSSTSKGHDHAWTDSFGAPFGLVEIGLEPSTNDGRVHNPLGGNMPAVLGEGMGATLR